MLQLYAVVGAISTHSVSSRGSVDANPVTMVTNVSANLDVVRGSDVDDHAVMADDVDVDAASVLKHTMGQCVNTVSHNLHTQFLLAKIL